MSCDEEKLLRAQLEQVETKQNALEEEAHALKLKLAVITKQRHLLGYDEKRSQLKHQDADFLPQELQS